MLAPAFFDDSRDIGQALAGQANVVLTTLIHSFVDDVVAIFTGCSACRHSIIIVPKPTPVKSRQTVGSLPEDLTGRPKDSIISTCSNLEGVDVEAGRNLLS